jgi:hypothetical protein
MTGIAPSRRYRPTRAIAKIIRHTPAEEQADFLVACQRVEAELGYIYGEATQQDDEGEDLESAVALVLDAELQQKLMCAVVAVKALYAFPQLGQFELLGRLPQKTSWTLPELRDLFDRAITELHPFATGQKDKSIAIFDRVRIVYLESSLQRLRASCEAKMIECLTSTTRGDKASLS